MPSYRILENNSFDGRTKWSAVHTRAADGRMGEFEAWYGNNRSLNIWDGCSEKGTGGGFGRQWNVAGYTDFDIILCCDCAVTVL